MSEFNLIPSNKSSFEKHYIGNSYIANFLLQIKHGVDAFALYTKYNLMMLQSKNNNYTVRATNKYLKNGINISIKRIQQANKILQYYGLIEISIVSKGPGKTLRTIKVHSDFTKEGRKKLKKACGQISPDEITYAQITPVQIGATNTIVHTNVCNKLNTKNKNTRDDDVFLDPVKKVKRKRTTFPIPEKYKVVIHCFYKKAQENFPKLKINYTTKVRYESYKVLQRIEKKHKLPLVDIKRCLIWGLNHQTPNFSWSHNLRSMLQLNNKSKNNEFTKFENLFYSYEQDKKSNQRKQAPIEKINKLDQEVKNWFDASSDFDEIPKDLPQFFEDVDSVHANTPEFDNKRKNCIDFFHCKRSGVRLLEDYVSFLKNKHPDKEITGYMFKIDSWFFRQYMKWRG